MSMSRKLANFGERKLGVVAILLCICAAGVFAVGCTSNSSTTPKTQPDPESGPTNQRAEKSSVTLLTYDSFALTDVAFKSFTKTTGIAVKVVNAGDTGEMVNKAILTKEAPLGDVLWGVDNTFLDRTLAARLFEPSNVVTSDLDPAALSLVPNGEVVPVDVGDVCINYDKAALEKAGVPAPISIADLTKPIYKNMLVVQNPATSSPGLAFLLATIADRGSGSPWQETWAQLKDNGVLIVNGWTEAYETHFTAGGNDGDRPLVVSYGTSPVAAVLFGADPKAKTAPTGVAAGTCFRQVEFAGVLRGTKNKAAAEELLAYLISPEVQTDIQLNMFVSPVNRKATAAKEFTLFAVQPNKPLTLNPNEISKNRETWIDEWTSLML